MSSFDSIYILHPGKVFKFKFLLNIDSSVIFQRKKKESTSQEGQCEYLKMMKEKKIIFFLLSEEVITQNSLVHCHDEDIKVYEYI